MVFNQILDQYACFINTDQTTLPITLRVSWSLLMLDRVAADNFNNIIATSFISLGLTELFDKYVSFDSWKGRVVKNCD